MKFSIVAPVYNCRPYLERMVDSCRSQTFSNWEVLCTDDGSNDGSREYLEQVASEDSRFSIFTTDRQGASGARNVSMDHATGDVLVFIDADDFISPYLLSTLVDRFKDPSVDAVHYGLVVVDPQAELSFTEPKVEWERTLEEAFDLVLKPWRPWSVSVCRTAFRRNLADGVRFWPKIKHQDVLFKFTILGRVKKLVEVDTPLYAYVQSPNSAIRSPMHKERIDHIVIVMRELDRIYRESPRLLRRIRLELFPRLVKNFWKLTESAPSESREEMVSKFDGELAKLVDEGILPYAGFDLAKRFKLWWRIRKHKASSVRRERRSDKNHEEMKV